MKLIIGLGNPTRKYKFTRHNIGFLAIDRIAKDFSIKLQEARFSSLIGEKNVSGEKIVLMKPLTFMNLSGEAVRAAKGKTKAKFEDIIVICDDVNLDLGRLRIRKSGSSGGHNGLKSIIEHLGTNEFARLRIGINTGKKICDLSEYVLEEFGEKELKVVDKILDVVSDAVKVYIGKGAETTMTNFNKLLIS